VSANSSKIQDATLETSRGFQGNTMDISSKGNQLIQTPQIQARAASIQTRAIAEQPLVWNTLPKHHIPPEFKLDISPWINRPIYCGTYSWPATAARFSMISTTGIVNLPFDIFNIATSIRNLMPLAALYRMKLCLNVSLTGTISHQGTLLVSILPPQLQAPYSDSGRKINTMLSGPHAFLSANEASSVCLEVPWYYNMDLGLMDLSGTTTARLAGDLYAPNLDVATLSVMVLNPLVPATSATTSVSLVVEAFFKELDLYVPTPRSIFFTTTPPTSFSGEGLWEIASKATDSVFDLGKRTAVDMIDGMRGTLRSYTGLHNPNVTKLDDKHIMSFRNYLNVVDSGTCMEKLDPNSTTERVTQDYDFHTSVDEMMIKNIISKPQYLGSFQVSTTNNTGALLWARPISPYQGGTNAGSMLANNIETLYWMTRAWKGGMKIHIQSAMSNKHSVKLKVVKLYAPSSTVQTQYPPMAGVINAPSDLLEFSAGNQTMTVDLAYLSRNRMLYNSKDNTIMSALHGMYYIYVAQPLVAGDSAPTTVEFNVYMSCDSDFQYYGYSKDYATAYAAAPTSFVGESAEVMNRPSDQRPLLQHSAFDTEIEGTRLVPLVDVRPLIRRFQVAFSRQVTIPSMSNIYTDVIDLAPLIAEAFGTLAGSNAIIPALYYGKNPGLKFKVKVTPNAITNIQFVAPNMFFNNTVTPPVLTRTQPVGPFPYPNNFPDLAPGSGTAQTYPLPGVEMPAQWNLFTAQDSSEALYEFVVPNTSILKFIGGPEKMSSTNPTQVVSPCSDMGNVMISFNGNPGDVITYTVYYAFTDETRLGFQVIAPVVVPGNNGTPTFQTPDQQLAGAYPPMALPPSLYFSNLVTSYS